VEFRRQSGETQKAIEFFDTERAVPFLRHSWPLCLEQRV
jgi:hypothetical protein